PADGRPFSRYRDARPGRSDEHRRLAWGSGDLSVAAALLVAGRGAGLPARGRGGVAIAPRAGPPAPPAAGRRGAGARRAAGAVGRLFSRMYQATGDPALGAAARSWFRRTLDMRQPGRGIGGYQACRPDLGPDAAWVDDPGLLTGAAGVALALLAAITPVEPA